MTRFFSLFRSIPLFVLASAAGVFLLVAASLFVFFLDLRAQTPADWLPASQVQRFFHMRGGEETLLTSLVPLPPSFHVPDGLQGVSKEGQFLAVLRGKKSGDERWVAFQRLKSGRAMQAHAENVLAPLGARAAIKGVYAVFGSEDLSGILPDPASPQSLARDSSYRLLLSRFGASTDTAVVRSGISGTELSSLLGSTSPLGIEAEERHDGAWLSVLVPEDTPLAPPHSGAFPLADPASFPGLSLGVRGQDLGNDFQEFLTRAAGNDGQLRLILHGALEALFARSFGEARDITSVLQFFRGMPYAFLLRAGSGGVLHWVLATRAHARADMTGLLGTLEEGFSFAHPPATLRRRMLPGGRVVQDIIADPGIFHTGEREEQGHRVRVLSATGGEAFAHAARGSSLLLSDNPALLFEVLRAPPAPFGEGSVPPEERGALQSITLDGALLERFQPFVRAFPVLTFLHTFLPEGMQGVWYKVREGGVVRHSFHLRGYGTQVMP